MAFHETWTRTNANSEMEYGTITDDPRKLNDWQLATRLGLGWITKQTAVRTEDAINIYAGRKCCAIVWPSGDV